MHDQKNREATISQEMNKACADSLLSAAQQFKTAYEAVKKEYPEIVLPKLWKPKFYLVCHGLELALKSFIVNQLPINVNIETYIKKIGHNLTTCLNDAKRHGLNILDPKEERLINKIAPDYKDKAFEYLLKGEGHDISVDEHYKLHAILNKLVEER